VVQPRLPIPAIAAVEHHVVVGRRGRRARPGAVVERRVAVRIVHDTLQHRAARIHEGRHVHVRVRGVVERVVAGVVVIAVGVAVAEADDGGVDVSRRAGIPDDLLERMVRVAALADLDDLPRLATTVVPSGPRAGPKRSMSKEMVFLTPSL